MLIQSDEDGNPVRWLKPEQIADIEGLMEDYGIKRFVDEIDESDPSYWSDGRAMLFEVRLLRVRPKKIVTSWTVEPSE
jgi:hypothetical protein